MNEKKSLSQDEAILPIPDETITIQAMHEYGYTWDGMLPLGEDAARRLYKSGAYVYCLRINCTEAAVWHVDEIGEHAKIGGIFGIDKNDWKQYLLQNNQKQTVPTSELNEQKEDLYRAWNECDLMDDEDYYEWYSSLTENEQALIDAWDNQYSKAVSRLCQDILAKEATQNNTTQDSEMDFEP